MLILGIAMVGAVLVTWLPFEHHASASEAQGPVCRV